ncbi:MAG: hypothetical protein AAF399_07565 [Bacteroidota bacterium]
MNSLLHFSPALMEVPQVQEKWELFKLRKLSYYLQGHQGGSYKIVAANLMGTLVGVKVPTSFIEASENPSLFKEVSCNCNVGDGCNLISMPEHDTYLCSGDGCSSCSMTVIEPGKD